MKKPMPYKLLILQCLASEFHLLSHHWTTQTLSSTFKEHNKIHFSVLPTSLEGEAGLHIWEAENSCSHHVENQEHAAVWP